MTQEDIIEMARQAASAKPFHEFFPNLNIVVLEAFAKLVAAKICAQRAKDFEDLLKKYGHEHDDGARVGASQCEQMIRARGEA